MHFSVHPLQVKWKTLPIVYKEKEWRNNHPLYSAGGNDLIQG